MSESLEERLLAGEYNEANAGGDSMLSQGMKQSGFKTQGSYVSLSSRSSETTDTPSKSLHQRTKNVSWDIDGVDSIAEDFPTAHLEEENLWGLDAAIVIHEGFLNIPLREHPASKRQIQYWKFLHHGWFPYFDLFMALVFLALAIVEKPAVPGIDVPKYGILAVQVLCLVTNAVQVYLKFQSAGNASFWRPPKGTEWQVTVMILLAIDVAIFLHTDKEEFRILRIFRPAYLLSCEKAAEIRRVVRSIFRVLYEVFELVAFLFFYVGVWGITGTFLFAPNKEDSFFANLGDAYTQLFVLITTCNYPSVMLPAYTQTYWAFFFFFFYIIIGIYFMLNLFLAVVYRFYTLEERIRFRGRFLRQRKAIRRAFHVLTTARANHGDSDDRLVGAEDEHPIDETRSVVGEGSDSEEGISLGQFQDFMKHYSARYTRKQALILFRALDPQRRGKITLSNFYSFYEMVDAVWVTAKYSADNIDHLETVSPTHDSLRNMTGMRTVTNATVWSLGKLAAFTSLTTRSKVTPARIVEHLTDVAVCSEVIYLTIEASQLDNGTISRTSTHIIMGFLGYFTLDIIAKLILLGRRAYYAYAWHRFDLFFTVVGWILVTVDLTTGTNLSPLMALRTFRLTRLLTLTSRKTLRQFMSTAFTIIPSMARFSGALFCVYYAFAITGMTFLGNTASNCPSDASSPCGTPYADIPGMSYGHYQEMNFNDVWSSYVTLFTLMVVNDWNNTMGGHAVMATTWSRAFFMLFYVFTVLIVVNVILSYVLEMFQVVVAAQQARELSEAENHKGVSAGRASNRQSVREVEANDVQNTSAVLLSSTVYSYVDRADLMSLRDDSDKDLQYLLTHDPDNHNAYVAFEGTRHMTQYTLYLVLFSDSLQKWIREDEQTTSGTLAAFERDSSVPADVAQHTTFTSSLSLSQNAVSSRGER
eukprot:m.590198 g.590198  ORF g.590198 m.590198 type:complete len:927 (-) comp22376_c0_seq10:1032-3812(-)